ncbi:hypothetical protein [Congregibacter litoralis]|uniref:Uncharacterized protein n=1 Tax=Congregibacter litoralis KT71 TaxID=314285 RepID=A4ACH1_9GAMM|nr:hypothetical protein [Congregibacter litoralis]EAQ96399.1 hypothetical protein KT71_13470 [Congregibacter litoralis KT71]
MRQKPNSKGMHSNGRKAGGGTFTKVLHTILDHPDYLALSTSARAFLWDMTRQLKPYGENNGNIAASEGVMKKFGYSRFQCCRLRKELETYKWIEVTRYPRAKRDPLLYRFTWLPTGDWKGAPNLDAGAHEQKVKKLT